LLRQKSLKPFFQKTFELSQEHLMFQGPSSESQGHNLASAGLTVASSLESGTCPSRHRPLRRQRVTPAGRFRAKRKQLKGFTDFHLKVKSQIWPWLSYMCRMCLTVLFVPNLSLSVLFVPHLSFTVFVQDLSMTTPSSSETESPPG